MQNHARSRTETCADLPRAWTNTVSNIRQHQPQNGVQTIMSPQVTKPQTSKPGRSNPQGSVRVLAIARNFFLVRYVQLVSECTRKTSWCKECSVETEKRSTRTHNNTVHNQNDITMEHTWTPKAMKVRDEYIYIYNRERRSPPIFTPGRGLSGPRLEARRNQY